MKLLPQDTVAIIAPARWVMPAELAPAIATLEGWGLRVSLGEHVFTQYRQFGGTDDQRRHDLQKALDDPNIKAVFCARGGYGITRILDELDLTAFNRSPKWLVGYSDVTALHGLVQNQGLPSLHATMPLLFGTDTPASLRTLKEVLFGQLPEYQWPAQSFNRPGEARGQLVGGNLSLLVSGLGTNSEVQTQGNILFLEDLDEYLYHIDRMLVQLKRAGKLAGLAGLVVGHFSKMRDNTLPFGQTAAEIVAAAVADFSFPVAFGFPAGHDRDNWALPLGLPAQLLVKSSGSELLYEPVASPANA